LVGIARGAHKRKAPTGSPTGAWGKSCSKR